MRDWLKETRTERGLTMAQMAERLDITESYYSLIESGERQKKMDISFAWKLSQVLSVPVDRIVEMEGK